tara:strand:- start:79 stop:741 length:663 start_codon:yes stop_codon:yes gene_type:complete
MKLSFCITCWTKDFKFIKRIIPLLEAQTSPPDEFVLSASSLTDLQLLEIPSRINGTLLRVVNSTAPLYAGGARNQGGKFASCDLVTFCDIDDLIHPQKIEVTREAFLRNPTADAFVHNYSKGAVKEFPVIKTFKFYEIADHRSIYLKPPEHGFSEVTHGHLTLKRSILDKCQYADKLRRGQDAEFCSGLFHNKYKIFYSNEKLISYIPSRVSQHIEFDES